MDTQELCPLCGEGHVTEQVEQVETDYKGHQTLLAQHFLLCDHCGSDFAGAAQAKLNKRALMAWRKQVDGLLTGAEVAALRDQYHLTQALAARLFGGGPVAFSKYENDDVVQSESMDTLLRLVRRSPEAFRALAEEKGMTDELALTRPVRHVARSATVISINRRQEEPSPQYVPREFRTFTAAGAQSCK
jgi:HTH-type transcriptional regulator/antitoxin MqsA